PGSGTPSGTVVFKEGSRTLGSGTLGTINGLTYASFATSALAAGAHVITAVYLGDASDLPSAAAPFTVRVGPAAGSSRGLAAAPAVARAVPAPPAATPMPSFLLSSSPS